MLSMLDLNILVGILVGIRMGILAGDEGMLAGDRRTKNCDFVHNPMGRLGLTLDKTKRHPMQHCHMEHCRMEHCRMEHCMEG